MIREIDPRSGEILKLVVDLYCETSEPVGSQTVSKRLNSSLSPATVRNIMAWLEEEGLLYSPHTSAGRLPTEDGLRVFVDGLLEIDPLNAAEKSDIGAPGYKSENDLSGVLDETLTVLSQLSKCVSLIFAPKGAPPLKHIEFFNLQPERVLVVLIATDGSVENRIINVPEKIETSDLIEAGNYLTKRLHGSSLEQARGIVFEELRNGKAQLSKLAESVVTTSMAVWEKNVTKDNLIIKGQSHLLRKVNKIDDLKSLQALIVELEAKEGLLNLLDAVIKGEGIQVLIGAESQLLNLNWWSMVLTPYRNQHHQVLGVVGVIGPIWLKYSHVIPMVEYTAEVISELN